MGRSTDRKRLRRKRERKRERKKERKKEREKERKKDVLIEIFLSEKGKTFLRFFSSSSLPILFTHKQERSSLFVSHHRSRRRKIVTR